MALVDDIFDNLDQWTNNDSGGTSSIDTGRLKQACTGTYQSATMLSEEALSGEFDIIIDWEKASTDGTLKFEVQNSGATAQSSISLSGSLYSAFDATTNALGVTSGTLRIIRTIDGSESTYRLYYDEGGGWSKLSENTQTNTDPVYVQLSLSSVSASSATGYWDNFAIGDFGAVGLTDDTFDDLHQWSIESGGTGTASIDTGRLKIASASSGNLKLWSREPLSGDFDISIDFDVSEMAGAWEAWFALSEGYGYQAFIAMDAGGYIYDSYYNTVARTSDTGRLRIVREISGSDANWSFYADQGSGSTLIGTTTTPDIGNLSIVLASNSDEAFSSYWDNLDVPGVVEAAEFVISATLPQFGDSSSRGNFSIASFLPQFGGSLEIRSLSFTVAAELPQFGCNITTVQGRLFDVSARLPQFGGSITVAHGRLFAVAATLPQFGGRVVMSHGKMFSVAAKLPQFGGSINVWVKSDFSIAVGLPQFGGKIEFLGEVVALSVNVFHGGVCKYKGLDFNSIFIAEDGLCYVINDDGIHLVTGADDNGDEIDAWFESGDLNLNIGQAIRMEDITILGRSEGDTMLTLFPNGEDTGEDYIEAGDPSGNLYPNRFIPDKGIEGHTWRYRVSNVDGSGLSVQQLRMMYHYLSRKVS